MPLGEVSVEAFAPWVGFALDAFGAHRCLFASNFPVDGMHATFDELYSVYAALVADVGDDAREALFATNAERVYRC
jgi:predicted TIM-barrel fold metal-dependent hydrolase